MPIAMKSPLRILLLEDNADDAQLIQLTLAHEGIEYAAAHVETEQDFVAALRRESFDLVLSDYSLPSFDGLSALKITKALSPCTPFIFVSGTIGEEFAIDTVKSGATDYVLKHRLSRLAPAVRRAMAEAAEREGRELAEKSRAEAQSLFRALFDQVTVGVAIADLGGRLLMANPTLAAILGHQSHELSHTHLVQLLYREDRISNDELDHEVIAGKRASYEEEAPFVRKDGTRCWCRRVVSPMRGDGGEPRYLINLVEDISGRKEMENRFLQAEKMEVVGRLAAGFAHDFNNVLTLINGYSQLLLQRISPLDPSRMELQEIRKAGERATTLTRRLLTFSRQHVRRLDTLHLNSIVSGLEQTLRHLIGDRVRLIVKLDGAAGLIEEDQTQMEQVIMNLAINARDAMPDGGDLIIVTENTRMDGVTAERHGVAPGDFVALAVTDTGHGMDAATQSRIFDPFFTTKAVGKGTGLGLWMVRESILKSGGALTVDSTPGEGTTFRLWLPRVAGEAGMALTSLAQSIARESPGGSETILFVDADEAVRNLGREILQPAGYRVLQARDGKEAQALAECETEPIHLLLAGMEMPPLSDVRGDLKVLYLSGLPQIENESRAYVQKPFTSDTLLCRVREALDGSPGAMIVVADDDPAIRSFLRHILWQLGHRVLEASNGRQAMEYLRQQPVDLLITDLLMPEQEGLETIRRARGECADLPVVAMSGGFGEQFLGVAHQMGASAVLHKPFEADTVREMVRRILKAGQVARPTL